MAFEVSHISRDNLPFEPGSPSVDLAMALSARVLHQLGLKPDAGLRRDYTQLSSLGLDGVLYPRLSVGAQSFNNLLESVNSSGVKIFNCWGSKGYDGIVGYTPFDIDAEGSATCEGRLAVYSTDSESPHPLLHGTNMPFDEDAVTDFTHTGEPPLHQSEYYERLQKSFIDAYDTNHIEAIDIRDFLMLIMLQLHAKKLGKPYITDMNDVILVNPGMGKAINRDLRLGTGRFNFFHDYHNQSNLLTLDYANGASNRQVGIGLSVGGILSPSK